jgi:molybdopterin-guanine dinucleotide biosynthesis protein A
MMSPLGVILAGGKASRMGGVDKCFLPLMGRLVIDSVMERLVQQVPQIAINANGDLTRFENFNLPTVSDSVVDFPGPLAGVLAGLDWAATQGASHILTVAADTPFFPMDLRIKLERAQLSQSKPISLAATQGVDRLNMHPTFGLWPVALREDLRCQLGVGVRKVVQWAERHGKADAIFNVISQDPFFNINTPEDLMQAEAMR